ncbi:uncharacterized protein AC631_01821 [Debaryomyces fabryi]|uniref:Choline transport protein n=1 Tax=Debaryomyces fabryi TaxID=58627 RepID=A0A0V1Q1P6_9ASCO|nr:uncharacterized protein AC631_01821 [Debaryomyces fabryi]KSA02452.1 hypothetical protein AC631_01821 [Debaryomyces fabryi]CUM54837.1 unnamed protein product [Debaryomyces fabryi]
MELSKNIAFETSNEVEIDENQTELSTNFTWWSLFGISFGLTNSWLGISSSLATGISSGGPTLIVYGLLIGFIFNLAVAITLSELVSVFPNSGGQYYWTLCLAPNKHKRFLSYSCGCLSYAGALFTNASITSGLATSIMAIYDLCHPTFNLKRWHIFVTYEILNLFVSIFNLWDRYLPLFTSSALYVSIFTFAITLVACLSCSSGAYQLANFVFKEFDNATGWKSPGIGFIVGLVNPLWSYVGIDSATHMVDELGISRSRILIPRAILGTVVLGFVTAFIYSISMFFCISDPNKVVEAILPILEIFHQSTKSKSAAIVLQSLCITTGFLCNIVANTWQARICWSFSRDRGLPGSKYWRIINQKSRLPINAHLISNFWIGIIGCIFLASSTAFNAIITACITLLLISYSIPTACLLARGRHQVKEGYFWLGKIGLISNIMTLIWTLFCLIFLSFPYVLPVAADSMNYVSVVYVTIALYIVIYWTLRKSSIICGDKSPPNSTLSRIY